MPEPLGPKTTTRSPSFNSKLPELEAWLAKWDIPYDEIVYGKLWPGHKGLYVDDRSVRPDEFLKYSV